MFVGVGFLWMGWFGFNGGVFYVVNLIFLIVVFNINFFVVISFFVWICFDVIFFGKFLVIGVI